MTENQAFTVEIVKGNIVEALAEAIVTAANTKLWMGAGVAGAIKAAGGESVEQEAIAKGPIPPGQAVATTAGRLRYKYVIHAAVMGQDLRTNDRYIRQATIASLNLADRLQLKSVAPPAFGTGVGGFPMTACANIMVKAARGFRTEARHLERVVFCLYDELGYRAFLKAAEAHR